MKKTLLAGVAMLGALAIVTAGCSSSSSGGGTSPAGSAGGSPSTAGKLIKVGFAQTGSESGWRAANTEAMKKAFSKANGFDLVFNAADNDPAAQIAAVRSFISQGVDAIVIAPIVSDGWDDVLNEAKTAKIPVVLEDRTTSSPDTLFASWVGDDFKKEGETAGQWAAKQYGSTPTKMVVLEGTTGSAPANDRAAGFADAIKGTQITTIASQTGDFTRDGVHDGMQALVDGKINFIVECNPLLGDQAADLVKKVLAGTTVEKKNFAQDGSFTKEQAAAVIATRAY